MPVFFEWAICQVKAADADESLMKVFCKSLHQPTLNLHQYVLSLYLSTLN